VESNKFRWSLYLAIHTKKGVRTTWKKFQNEASMDAYCNVILQDQGVRRVTVYTGHPWNAGAEVKTYKPKTDEQSN